MVTWLIHHVCDGQIMSYHTHGLDQYGSLELELNLMLKPEQAGQFINLIGLSIAEGKRYRSGDCVKDIFTLPFYLLETDPIHGTYGGERVLRIIFCDPSFHFPWDAECDLHYRIQLSEVEIMEMKHLLANVRSTSRGGLLS